jgi:membrane protease YdiL (CAAX protease family)
VSRAIVVFGVASVIAGLGAGTFAVFSLETEELESISPAHHLAPSNGEPHMELLREELEEGEWALFEVCAADGFGDRWLGRAELIVWMPESQEVIVRVPLDRAHLALVRRSEAGGCLLLGQSVDRGVPVGGTYAIEAVWAGRELSSELLLTPVFARITARRPLSPSSYWPVLLIALGAALVIGGLTPWKRVSDSIARMSTTSAAGRIARALALFIAFVFALGELPIVGSLGAAIRGALIAASEIALAVLLIAPTLARRARPPEGREPLIDRSSGEAGPAATPIEDDPRPSRLAALGFVRGRGVLALALAAPFAGLALWFLGGIARVLVPSTGVAPIETLVSWPSGVLATALVALVAPVAEEVFFRGFVYGVTASRFGVAVAFVVSFTTFGIAHLPQQWGAWGIFASVMLVGIGLTALRAVSGSLVPSLLAHLAHNGAIVLLSLAPDG